MVVFDTKETKVAKGFAASADLQEFTPELHFPTNQCEVQNVIVELPIGAV